MLVRSSQQLRARTESRAGVIYSQARFAPERPWGEETCLHVLIGCVSRVSFAKGLLLFGAEKIYIFDYFFSLGGDAIVSSPPGDGLFVSPGWRRGVSNNAGGVFLPGFVLCRMGGQYP